MFSPFRVLSLCCNGSQCAIYEMIQSFQPLIVMFIICIYDTHVRCIYAYLCVYIGRVIFMRYRSIYAWRHSNSCTSIRLWFNIYKINCIYNVQNIMYCILGKGTRLFIKIQVLGIRYKNTFLILFRECTFFEKVFKKQLSVFCKCTLFLQNIYLLYFIVFYTPMPIVEIFSAGIKRK